jgi:AmmeMemoRadiSam system protein A
VSELTPADRARLLAVARRAIESGLGGKGAPHEDVAAALREPCGAFVTIRRRADGELRGCVGFIEAQRPLVEAVEHAAAAAATSDTRFEPVRSEELPELGLEISVLGPLRPVRPEEVEVGRHGLLVRHGRRQGLLLPQVATEHGWDRETFLDKTCVKAGLPAGTWRKPEAELLGFTAEVFGEE